MSYPTPIYDSLTVNNISTTVNILEYNTDVASTVYVRSAVLADTATLPLINVTGGTYNFQTLGTGAQIAVSTAGGVITSVEAIDNGGANYQVGDILEMQGGNGDATLRVMSVSNGVVTGADIVYGGTGYTNGSLLTGGALLPGSRFGIVTGTLLTNVTMIMPAGTYLQGSRRVIFANNTTGPYTVTVLLSNGTGGSIGTGVVLPQGYNNSTAMELFTDGVTDVWPAVGAFANPVTFAQSPTAPTPAAGTNNNQVATTAFVQDAVAGGGGSPGDYATLAGDNAFTGTNSFAIRPTFNGATPWDSANLPAPVSGPGTSADQTIAIWSGTTGQVLESGTPLSNLAFLASPNTFTATQTILSNTRAQTGLQVNTGGLLMNLFVNSTLYSGQGAYGFINETTGNTSLSFNGATDVGTFYGRPMFGANTPWDSGNFIPSNYAPISNPTFDGTLTVNGLYVTIAGGDGTYKRYTTNTGSYPTWEWGSSDDSQTGSNAGSNFELWAMSDVGISLYTALQITRATGATAFYARPTFAGNLAWDAGNFNPASYLPLTGGALTGALTNSATQPAVSDSSTTVPTTAWVQGAIAAGGGGGTTSPTFDNLTVTGTAEFDGVSTFANNAQFNAPVTFTSVGASNFAVRPTFGSATPWDSANFNPSNYLPLTGGTLTGPVKVSGAAGTARMTLYETNGIARWSTGTDVSPENGSNSGSNWVLQSYSDTGADLNTVWTISRATGQVQFNTRPMFGTNTPWDSANFNPALYATLASPAITGVPTAPTATAGTNSTQLATTAYVVNAFASPALTGTPTAPNPTYGNSSGQIATTAFVQTAVTSSPTRTCVSATTTIAISDYYVGVKYPAACAIALNAGISFNPGQRIIIKDESGAAGTNHITITANGTDKIDGQSTVTISTNFGVVHLIWNSVTDVWSVI
jgi:hypothetical protein